MAAVYNQSYALSFDGNDYVECGAEEMLNITEDLTIEADTVDSPGFGDFDGDGAVSMSDVTLFEQYISESDGVPWVDEGMEPDSVDLINFGPNFSIYDLDYDGIVDGADKCLMPVLGDFDGDFVIDTADLAALYLGGTRAGDLAAAGRIAAHTPGALDRADRLFLAHRAPWCVSMF